MLYRCYFIETDGIPAAWRAFQCESDREAQDYALGLFVGYPHVEKVEVWENTRLTFSYCRPVAHTPEDLRKLCFLAIAAAKKETDESTKLALAARVFALAQEAEALERPQLEKEPADGKDQNNEINVRCQTQLI